MVREAMEIGLEEASELETFLHFLRIQSRRRAHSSVLSSAAARRRRRRTTRIRSRRSRLARPFPLPADAPAGPQAPSLESLEGLEGLLAAATLGVDQDQPPEAIRGERQEPELEFARPPLSRVDHGVPSSAGGIVDTASDNERTPASRVRFHSSSAYWAAWTELGGFEFPWILLHLARDLATSTPATTASRTGSGAHELAHHAMPNASS